MPSHLTMQLNHTTMTNPSNTMTLITTPRAPRLPAFRALSLTLVSAALLAGCGGGGGTTATSAGTGSSGSGSSGGGTSTIVTSVPAATYTAGSQEKAAYDYLNAERAKCGFGLLAQNAKLDVAAAAHANYIVTNNTYGHSETAGTPGFTGTTPAARATAAGYAGWYVGEVAGAGNVGDGLTAMKSIFAAPYHLNALIQGVWDVGVSYKGTGTAGALVLDLGVPSSISKAQVPVAGTVLTYPCAGSAVADKYFVEYENWTGGTAGAGFGGAPVIIKAPRGEVLAISSASYTAGGVSVPIRVLTSANDPNRLLQAHSVALIPPAALAANTTYRVLIAGTAAGVGFTKDFTFTTGN